MQRKRLRHKQPHPEEAQEGEAHRVHQDQPPEAPARPVRKRPAAALPPPPGLGGEVIRRAHSAPANTRARHGLKVLPKSLDDLDLPKDLHARYLRQCEYCKKPAAKWHLTVCKALPWRLWRAEVKRSQRLPNKLLNLPPPEDWTFKCRHCELEEVGTAWPTLQGMRRHEIECGKRRGEEGLQLADVSEQLTKRRRNTGKPKGRPKRAAM